MFAILGLYLTALACLLIAAKMEEQEIDIPSLSSLITTSGEALSAKDLQIMEFIVLEAWQWNGRQ